MIQINRDVDVEVAPTLAQEGESKGGEAGTVVLARNVLRAPAPEIVAPRTGATQSPRAVDDTRLSVRRISSLHELRNLEASWQDLADDAAEPNPFYEPWMALPALECLGAAGRVEFLAVEARTVTRDPKAKLLCGLIPLTERRIRGVPLTVQSLWKHEYCYLTTPLVRSGLERPVICALLKHWEENKSPGQFFSIDELPVDGPVHRVLIEALWGTRWTSLVAGASTRAFFRPDVSSEAFLARSVSGKKRKEYRRQQARLAETGAVHIDELTEIDQLPKWTDEFCALEAAGWKGTAGVAVAASDGSAHFFKEMLRQAMLRDRLMALALRVDGQSVALKLNLLAGGGGYAFKITYDETMARFSPGVLLELENIHRLHARTDVAWMDSCASPNRFMINQLWSERRQFQRLVLAPDDRLASLALSALPLVRWAKQLGRDWQSLKVSS